MNNHVRPDEAKNALESVRSMESAGNRRAVPSRWFGAGIALLVGSLFAIYALQDPYPYIIFPIIGIGILIAVYRERAGAYARTFPANDGNKWVPVAAIVLMIAVFFATVFARRAYDLAWLPIVVGLFVSVVILLTSESERKIYLAKAQQAKPQ